MLRNVIILLLLIIAANVCFAQETFQQADIVGKKWKIENVKGYIKYTKTKKIWRTFLQFSNQYYYLSDTIETTFDKSKVGKSTNGKYIIFRNKWERNGMEIYEILLLTYNTLILQKVTGIRIGGSNTFYLYTEEECVFKIISDITK